MTRDPITDPEVLADLRLRAASEDDRRRVSPVLCAGCGHHVRDHHATSGVCMHAIDVDEFCACEQFERGGGPQWSPPVIVERWPCSGCDALVEITADAIEMHAKLSRELVRRGQRSLERRIPCADCKRREDEERIAKQRPHGQTEIREAAPAEQRPSWMPTPRAERRRTR